MKFVVNHHDAHKHSKMQQTAMHTSIPKCNKPRAFQNATNHDAHLHSKVQQTTMHTSIPKCNKPRAFQNATNPNAINGSKARKESIVIHKKK